MARCLPPCANAYLPFWRLSGLKGHSGELGNSIQNYGNHNERATCLILGHAGCQARATSPPCGRAAAGVASCYGEQIQYVPGEWRRGTCTSHETCYAYRKKKRPFPPPRVAHPLTHPAPPIGGSLSWPAPGGCQTAAGPAGWGAGPPAPPEGGRCTGGTATNTGGLIPTLTTAAC